MEERQPVGDDVVGGPLPGIGEGVEVGGDRAAGQDGALGRAGGPRGVDDQRRSLLVGLVREVAAARGEVHVDARPRRKRSGQVDARRAEDGLGRGVLEDVPQLAPAGLGVDGHRGDTGEERADDGDGRLGRGHRPHADPLGARHLAGDVGGRVAQLCVGQLGVAEAQGEAVVGVAQRREEHVRDPSTHARRGGHRLRRPRGPAPRRASRPGARARRGRRAHPGRQRQPDRPRRSLGPGAPADARRCSRRSCSAGTWPAR